MSIEDELSPPVADEMDEALVAVRGGLSLIPVVGGAAVELVNFVFGSPLEERFRKWHLTVAGAIKDLTEKHGVAIETLRDNPAFIDAVLAASDAARKTSQTEKLDALRNAASWTTTWDTLTTRRADSSRSRIPSARKCYRCLRNDLSPIIPEWT